MTNDSPGRVSCRLVTKGGDSSISDDQSAGQLRKYVIGVERRRRDRDLDLEESSKRASFGFDPRGDEGLATVGEEHDAAGLGVRRRVLDEAEVVAGVVVKPVARRSA